MPKTRSSKDKSGTAQERYRQEMKEKGYALKSFFLSPEAVSALESLARLDTNPRQDIVSKALVAYLKAYPDNSTDHKQHTGSHVDIQPILERLASLEHTVGSILEQLGRTEAESPTQPPEAQLVRISGTVTKPVQSNEMVEKILQLAGELWLENDELSLGDILKRLHAKGITYYAKSQSLGKAVRKDGGKEAVMEKAKLRREQASLLG